MDNLEALKTAASAITEELSENPDPTAGRVVLSKKEIGVQSAALAVVTNLKSDPSGLPSGSPMKNTKKKKKRPGGLSIGPIGMSASRVDLEQHVLGCKSNPIPLKGAALSPSRLKGKSAEAAKKLASSKDTYTLLIALEDALVQLLDMGPGNSSYPALFSYVAGMLDKMEGADIMFDGLKLPKREPGRFCKRCCYLGNIPELLAGIRNSLTLSPKNAFHRYSENSLPKYQEVPNRTLAKEFVGDTLMNSKCNSEIDGLNEMELPKAFQKLWDTIPSDLQEEIKVVYTNRCKVFGIDSGIQLFYIEGAIADIMDVEA